MEQSLLQIAIIDDGINEKRYESIGTLGYNVEIQADLTISERKNYNTHCRSHGTICAAIIKKYAEGAVLSSVKILDTQTQSGFKTQLIKAISWCVDKEIKIIHLSLGSTYFKDFADISQAVELAHSNGAIIVAAYSNQNKYTCPASLDGVIGVKTDRISQLQEGEYVFRSSQPDGIEITACSRHALHNYLGELEFSELSNSYAAPMITAFVYQALCYNNKMDVEQIKARLEKKSFRRNWKEQHLKSGAIGNDLDIPIISIYGQMNQENLVIVEQITSLFQQDDYHAVAITDQKLDHVRSSMFSLRDYLEEEKLLIDIKSLNLFRNVHDPDVLLYISDFKADMSVDAVIDSDITVLIDPKLPLGEKIIENCEELLVVTNEPIHEFVNEFRVFEKKNINQAYQYIIHLFS